MTTVRYVRSPDDLPPGEHFCILTLGSETIPGDERSRTHPGHGYGESTVTTLSCTVYPNRAAWETEIAALSGPQPWWQKKSWVPLIAKVPVIETSVTVAVR